MKKRKNAVVADDAMLMSMDQEELVKYLDASNKVIAKYEKELAALMQEKAAEPDKTELIIEALIVEKKIVDELSNDMVATVNTGITPIAKDLKARMMPHLKRYNALVAEYLDKTGGKLTEADYSIPDNIMAKKDYAVLPVLTYSRVAADDEDTTPAETTHAVTVISVRDFRKYAAESDSAMRPVRVNLKNVKADIAEAEGQEKAVLIVKALGYQKTIIDSNVELCHAAMNTRSGDELARAQYRLECDVKDYNALVDQYEALTGSALTRASQSMPADVAAGRNYQVLPTITCTVNDPTDEMSEKDYKNAKKNSKNKAAQKEDVMDAAIAAKIEQQAEKDIAVLEHSANMKKRLIESERDAKCYRFGMTAKDAKRMRSGYNDELDKINAECNAARHFENADNERYYAVVRINPEVANYPNHKADVAAVREVRSEVIALLNKRDEINSKLIALYAGTEIANDGRTTDKRWSDVKKDASERIIKRDRKQAQQIEKLPATRREKQYLYDMMNSKLDAESTCAVLEARRKNGKKLSKAEKQQLAADINTQKNNVEYWTKELNNKVTQIKNRAENVKNSGYFEPV